MSNKILTVAIATFNMEKYLERCLKSILEPGILDDLEILVVNDGSTDTSLQIAQRFEKEFPQTIRIINKENGGYGSAINVAIGQARGKYFKTLDADDWFDGKSLIKLIDKLKVNNVHLIITSFSTEDKLTGESTPIHYQGIEYDKIYDFTDFCIREKTGKYGFAMHSITYQTKIVRMNDFRLSPCYYSDVDYSIYPLINVETVIFYDFIVYKYLIGRENQSVSMNGLITHINDHIYITKKLVDFYSVNYNETDSCLSLNIGYNAFNVVNNLIDILNGPLMYSDKKNAEKTLNELLQYLETKDSEIYQLVRKKMKLIKRSRPISK